MFNMFLTHLRRFNYCSEHFLNLFVDIFFIKCYFYVFQLKKLK